MNVRDQLICLADLGLADQQRKDLKDKQKKISQKADVAQKQSIDLAQKNQALELKKNELLSRRKKLDSEMQLEKGNLRKWELRADKIKGEREYSALISEIGSLKRVISNLETSILEVMEEQETLDKRYSGVKSNLDKAEKEHAHEWELIKDELSQIDAQVLEFNESRQHLTVKLPANLLKRYEQISSKRGDVGVAWIEKQICQACSRILPPELFLRVAKGEVLEQCPSCQRLLVAKELLPSVVKES